MKDSLALYRSIIDFVWQPGVRFHDLRCLYTFVWGVVGLILSECVNLDKWGLFRPDEVQAASKTRQFSRWLHNDKIKPSLIYRPLIKEALANWEHHKLYVALDTSLLWNRFVIVRLALVYRGRAIPLAWCVLPGQSAMVALQHYAHLLREVAPLLPVGSQVVLLADRGFVDVELMKLARDLGWGFRIRAKTSLWVRRATKGKRKLKALLPPRGHAIFYHNVWITEKGFGPVHLALAHVHTENGYETWAIISDDPTDMETFDEYGLRFDIEENFLDDKSAGFQLESSEIRDAEALSRLCLILATATLYLVSTGTATVVLGRRRIVDPHWFRGLSYLQIGWRWVQHALAVGKRLVNLIWLDPGPDPEPAMASRVQAAQPKFTLSTIVLIN